MDERGHTRTNSTGVEHAGADCGPSPLRTLNLVAGALVFFLSLAVYLLTVAPTVPFWDGGEFVTTSVLLGIPHPPGAPLLSLAGRVMAIIPFFDFRGGGFGQIAFRVNLIGVFSAAFSVLALYFLTVALIRRMAPLSGDPRRDFPVFVAGALTALTAAFSREFWANAVEVEAYMPALLCFLLVILCALRWEERKHDPRALRWLLLAAYCLGLGTGVHLTVLLAAVPLAFIVFAARPGIFSGGRFWFAVLSTAAFVTGVRIAAGHGVFSLLLPVAALIIPAAVFSLAGKAAAGWTRPFAVLCLLGALFAAGQSVYPAVMIRAAKHPAVNEGAPDTIGRYRAYLDREQYGQGTTGAMLRGMAGRKAEAGYQFGFMYLRSLLRQFPVWGPSVPVTFTNDRSPDFPGQTVAVEERAYVPLFVWALVFLGAGLHLRRDPRRFAALFSWFLLTSAGLVLYLNMENPQVRERDYFFLASYPAVMIWLGIGAFGVLRGVRTLLERVRSSLAFPVTVTAALVLATMVPAAVLTDPSGGGVSNAVRFNRSPDWIPLDYAVNFLETCAPDAILFTNGDNDTYPLWYAREVMGVRRDVTIVNLSLLNAPWYLRQLRDGRPGALISFDDAFIDTELTGASSEARLWDAGPREVSAAGMTWMMPPDMTGTLPDGRPAGMLSVAGLAVLDIIRTADGRRPIYFGVTVSPGSMIGLYEHLSLEGMAFRLVPERAPDNEYHIGAAALERNLFSRYRYRGLADSTLYKDAEVRKMLRNYSVAFVRLSEYSLRDGREADAVRVAGESFRIYYPDADIRMLQYSVFRQAGARDALDRLIDDEVRRLPRGDHRAAMEAGALFLRFSLPGGAVRIFRDMTGVWKDDPDVWKGYAAALFQAEDYRGAFAAAGRLREIAPGDPEVPEILRIIGQKLAESVPSAPPVSGEVR